MERVEGKIATGRFCSNMAAVFDRKVHAAIFEGKLACPHRSCSKKPIFYQTSGIFHHYNTIHGCNVPSSFLKEALMLSRKFHGDETKAYLENIYQHHAIGGTIPK